MFGLVCTAVLSPWGQQEDPDDTDFGIQSRGFDTRSIRFTHPLRVCCAMFASERLPTFLGWEYFPLGIDYMFQLPFVGFLMFWLPARGACASLDRLVAQFRAVSLPRQTNGPALQPSERRRRIRGLRRRKTH